MDSRNGRRTTMNVLSESTWNSQLNSDGFEKPSKIAAPPASSRLSMAGPGGLVGRASMLPSAPSNRLSSIGVPSGRPSNVNQLSEDMASMNLGQGQSRKSLGGNAGRVSNVPGSSATGGRPSLDRQSFSRRSSLKGGQNASIFKDPRPIRDKQFQQAAVKSLVKFLIDYGFNEQVSPKTLLSPSGKDFQKIFVFLYRFFEPQFEIKKRFEDEVPAVVRALKYPFPNDIGKSQLCAVGTPHTWPTVLVMLTWLVELILCQEHVNPENFEVDQEENAELFHNFVISAYAKFLDGDEYYKEAVVDLENFFVSQNEKILETTNELAVLNEKLTGELEELSKSESPLIALENQKSLYQTDIEKFKQFISRLETKKNKLNDSVSRLQIDVDSTTKEIEEFERLKADLQAQVDAQPMSPEDIDRLNNEKDHLTKTMESLNETRDELNKSVWDREMLLQKKMDSVEKLSTEYRCLGEKLGMIPLDAKNSSGIDFSITLKMHESRPELIAPTDFRNNLKPNLGKWRDATRDKLHSTDDQILITRESFERLNEAISDKKMTVSMLEEKVKRLQEQYAEEKEKFTKEGFTFNSEMEDLEHKIQKTNLENSNSYLLSQQSVQKVKIDHDNLIREIEEEQERMSAELFQICEDVIEFKNRKTIQIESLESKISEESQLHDIDL